MNGSVRRPEMLNRREEGGRGWILFLGILLALMALFLWADYHMTATYFVVEIEGSSMENTLQSGDLVYAERKFTARRGDVVIIDVSENEAFLSAAGRKTERIVKRIIAMEGDCVKCERGVVYLKQAGGEYEPLEEEYTKGMNAFEEFREFTVREGEIFVLGDNRGVSFDSRAFGTLEYDDIVGRVPSWSIDARKSITKWENFRSAVTVWL